MPRKYSKSQIKSKLRQIEYKNKQTVNKYNREVRKYNDRVKSAVNTYNQTVRTHNAKVLRDRNKIKNELKKLQSSSRTSSISKTTFRATYRTSVETLNTSYNNVITRSDKLESLNPQQESIYNLIEKENANNLVTSNVILANEVYNDIGYIINEKELSSKLSIISSDLNDRWKGAVFSLNPRNPDATRHFCTSARELFTQIIEMKAPDNVVFSYSPNCETTDRGNPTRKEKIKYLLSNKNLVEAVVEFTDNDISNVLELFHVLSEGTHGEAGKYSMSKLNAVKKRVEDGLYFLCCIAS